MEDQSSVNSSRSLHISESSSYELSTDGLIKTVLPGGGHLVIVGAGASHSLATTHNGDKNGKPLPVLRELVNVTGIKEIISGLGYAGDTSDFEAVYSALAKDNSPERLKPLNDKLAEYFGAIEIPDVPTNYDYMLAGLRQRDLVATFNWDPLLVQSYQRLRNLGLSGRLPHLLFLHGNVAIGYCLTDKISGPLSSSCMRCGKSLTTTPLLYPVGDKDYDSNEFIKAQWDAIRKYMKIAKLVTIYGYSAPVSDAAAIALLQDGWGKNTDRQFEQFELIIRPGGDEQVARNAWDSFIHTGHYHVYDDIMKSSIGRVPRRSVELWFEQNLEAKFVDVNPYPKCNSLNELYDWLQPLLIAENSSDISR